MGDPKGKCKAAASASTSVPVPAPVPTEKSHTSQQRQEKENINAQTGISQADTSLLSRIGASASGLARDTLVREGARGDAVGRGIKGLVGGKGGSGSGSQEFGGDHARGNEEELSTFLDGTGGLDGGFGDGVDSMEFKDEHGGDSATDFKRDFESRDKRNTRISGPVENSGTLDITSESGSEERDREYRDTSEMLYSVAKNPQVSTSTPREWEGVWSRASDISTPTPISTSDLNAQRQNRRDVQSNIDGTLLGQSAWPPTTTLTPKTDVLAQESHDGEGVLAILNTRIADGELAEQEVMKREMESHGEEWYWENIWGLDGEQKMKIVGMVRGLGGLERVSKSNESLELVPDYEREGREGEGEKWKSEWEGVLNGYVDEVWGGLLPLVKEARRELEGGRAKERGI
ncbi:hypothetical protein DID88_006070 [Monilinia fructigena]|uniref:Uncharacterized protein n=1 Tax=Monilinia fructigena TaxID=38457 RepID=A0A395J1J4_9HELO|nr:hypothetical protein DID88_006070 [Monilinia fructigena]